MHAVYKIWIPSLSETGDEIIEINAVGYELQGESYKVLVFGDSEGRVVAGFNSWTRFTLDRIEDEEEVADEPETEDTEQAE